MSRAVFSFSVRERALMRWASARERALMSLARARHAPGWGFRRGFLSQARTDGRLAREWWALAMAADRAAL